MSDKRLNLPAYPFQIEHRGNKTYIFDPLRKKRIILTPEEWVRQHFVQYLVGHKGYPGGLIQIEATVTLHSSSRRCDIVVFDRRMHPRVIVECKAPAVAIDNTVLEQIATYNSILRADCLMITNGITHYCCRIDYQTDQIDFLSDIPNYKDL